MAIMDEPALCERILARLAEGASTLAGMQARAGADSILISSAFAGGGASSRARPTKASCFPTRRPWSRLRGSRPAFPYTFTPAER